MTMPACDAVAAVCAVLPYLEAGAFIAIVLAVLGVPQMLAYYLDRRDQTESRAESERRHQETMTLLTGTLTALTTAPANNRQPAPDQPAPDQPDPDQSATDQSEAIANLQQAVSELTSQVAQLNERIQNGNGVNQPDTQHDD